MRYIFLVFIAFLLIACGQPGENPAGTVETTCADLRNDGAGSWESCPIPGNQASIIQIIPTAYAATIVINKPTAVSRSELVETLQQVSNATAVDVTIYARMEFDAGCNGTATWEIMPLQPFSVQAGKLLDLQVGGSCGDMPLGSRTLTAQAFSDAAGTIEIGRVDVNFTLVE